MENTVIRDAFKALEDVEEIEIKPKKIIKEKALTETKKLQPKEKDNKKHIISMDKLKKDKSTLIEKPDIYGVATDDELDVQDKEARNKFEKSIQAQKDNLEKSLKLRRDEVSKKRELNKKFETIISQIHSGMTFDDLFDLLVPSTGKCDTLAGELIRAINKVDYRWYNDGDRFFEDYGLETCGGAAAFIDTILSNLNINDNLITEPMYTIAKDNLDDTEYENAIEDVKSQLVSLIINNVGTFIVDNKKDMLNVNGEDYWNDLGVIPEYEIECSLPDTVQAHLEKGDISEEDIRTEIETFAGGLSYDYDDIIVSSYNVEITGIHKDTYDELDGNVYNWLEEYGQRLDDEFGNTDIENESLEPKLEDTETEQVPCIKDEDEFNKISFLIKDEYEAVEGYNNIISEFKGQEDKEQVIDVLKHIAEEEKVHIGQLQELMRTLDPHYEESTAEGKEEAEIQLKDEKSEEENAEAESPKDESLDKSISKYDLALANLIDSADYTIYPADEKNKFYLMDVENPKDAAPLISSAKDFIDEYSASVFEYIEGIVDDIEESDKPDYDIITPEDYLKWYTPKMQKKYGDSEGFRATKDICDMLNHISEVNLANVADYLNAHGKLPQYESLKEGKTVNLKDDEEVKAGKEFLDKSNEENIEQVVDVDADTIDKLKDSYIGNAILQCNVCKTLIYKKPEDLIKDENSSDDDPVYNIEDECPHCGGQSGYSLVGQVSSLDITPEEPKTTTGAPKTYDTDVESSIGSPLESNGIQNETPKEHIRPSLIKDESLVEEICEEDFDTLVNRYVNSTYENVKDYKTVKGFVTEDNKIVLEGIINYKSGKSRKTKFILEYKNKTKKNKYRFIGINETFTKEKKPFIFLGNIVDNKLYCESLTYKYNINSLQESKLLKGKVSLIEKTKLN